MNEVFIACKRMESEVRAAMESTGTAARLIWMEGGLHAEPEKLKTALQETLDRVERELAPDRILLGYGFCGNAILGLRAGNYELIVPRIDDCITMFIGSRERKKELEGGVGTLFFTADWVRDGDGMPHKDHLYEMFDEDEAEFLFDMMFGHYHRIAVLDTHCFPMEDALEKTREAAEEVGFEHCVFDASNEYLVRLLTGPWDEEAFIIKGPGDVIVNRDLWM